jgi:neurofibromin 1
MAKYISRIIFYLSSSNWPLILSRIKARISFLTTTIDESPDLVELRLMEWSNPDRTRLSQVIQEISTTFLHVKRPAQVAVATVLRSCIWKWIRSYPGELEVLVESNRNIEGGAESLFDVLNSASDISSSSSARKNKAFYPLMAMLLVVSPDTLKRAVLGEMAGRTSSSIAKRLNFLESLRKGLVTSKGFEACAVCYVDFVSAAMCLGPKLESAGVKSLVPDIQNDLKVRTSSAQGARRAHTAERALLLVSRGRHRRRRAGQWSRRSISHQRRHLGHNRVQQAPQRHFRLAQAIGGPSLCGDCDRR